MNSFVVDASVVIGLFVKEARSDACIRFFESTDDVRWIAPDAMFFEVAASLRKLEQRGQFDDVDLALAQLGEMHISAVSTKDLMQASARISRVHQVSPYDSFYLALSQRDQVPLITADERLVNGVKGKGFDVRLVDQS